MNISLLLAKRVLILLLLLLTSQLQAQSDCPLNYYTNKSKVETWVRTVRMNTNANLGTITTIGVRGNFYLIKVVSSTSKVDLYAVNYTWNDAKLVQAIIIPKYYTVEEYETELRKNYIDVSKCN